MDISALPPDKNSDPENGGSNRFDECLTPWIFFLILAASVFAAFPMVAVGLNTFFYRDSGALGYPIEYYLRESLLRGELPLWDPYSHCGVPFMAQWGNWYPFNFLSVFFPTPWFPNFFILAHLIWAGMGMYWLLRRWKVGTFAASFAAMAFVFNGVTMSCLIWGNYIASISWLPWLVGSVIVAWQQGGRCTMTRPLVRTSRSCPFSTC
ncbi:MAG: hypothetical protein ABIQ35_11930 [Verrucomicrobiota bacterium]